MTPLKLGIVGLCESARPLAETLLATSEFQLLGYWWNDVPEWMSRLAPTAVRERDPLSVINQPGLETLLVLGPFEGVKNIITVALAQGLKVLVLPLAEFESTFAYDLSVAAIDDAAPLFPCFLHRFSPQMNVVREELHDASLVEIDVELPSKGTSLRMAGLRQSLLPLADLVCWMWGDYRRVTTVVAGADSEQPTRLTVSLGGEHCPDTVISFRPGPAAKCVARVQHPAGLKSIDLGALTVDRSALSSCWRQESSDGSATGGTWSDLMRAFDLLDASQRSIRRKRTVEVSREFASERSQFKTQMTTAGCGVISFTLFAVLGLLLIGSALDPRDNQQRESEALGLVITGDDFSNGTAKLTDEASNRVPEIANALTSSTAVVLVESSGDGELEEDRVADVAAALAKEGLDNADARIVVRSLAGGTFRTFLVIGWIAGFLPLVIYLLLQTLIVVTAAPKSD